MRQSNTASPETVISDDLQSWSTGGLGSSPFDGRIMPGGLSAGLLQQLPAAPAAAPASGVPTTRIFRSRDEVESCAARVPRTIEPWAGEEGPRWRITVAPGGLRVGTKDYAAIDRTRERAIQRRLRDNGEVTIAEAEPEEATARRGGPRGKITAWSRQSRAGMVYRLATLDYAPLFAGERPPVLVTLTLPHDWERLAPTARDFKRGAVQRWQFAYRDKWGGMPIGVWKMEFQYRVRCAEDGCHDPRAPHLHILMRLPDVPLDEFKAWLSESWTKAIRPSREVIGGKRDREHRPEFDAARGELPCDCSEWCRSLSAGTAVDEEETLRYGDAKRIAIYYTKHGMMRAKEYQNTLPDSWAVAENGGARFWGRWGLEAVEISVDVDADIAAFVARVLRHVDAAGRVGDPVVFVRVGDEGGRLVRIAERDHPAARPVLVEFDDGRRDWVALDGYSRISSRAVLDGMPVEADPHKRYRLGRVDEVWRSKALPVDLAALPVELLERLIQGDADAFEETSNPPISANYSEDVRLRRVWAHPVTGELRIWRKRRVRRRRGYMAGTRGFLSVNDGVATMDQLSRAIEQHDEQRRERLGDPELYRRRSERPAPRTLQQLHDAPWTIFVRGFDRRAAGRRGRWASGVVPASPTPDASWYAERAERERLF